MTRYDEFLEMQAQETDDCILWPYAKNAAGYGRVWGLGKVNLAPRLSCQMAQGDAPTAKHEAAHSCHTPACLNPRHLRWATRTENERDKISNGTSNRGSRQWASKLTEYQVREMRIYARSGVKQQDLANYYGLGQATVSQILSGQRWGWLV